MRSARSTAAVAAAAAIVLCAGLSATATSASAGLTAPRQGTTPLTLAVLGDSYSSGEGGPTDGYLPGTNSPGGCRKNQDAWGFKLAGLTKGLVDMPSNSYFLACSGAESVALYESFKGQEPQATGALADLEAGSAGPAPTLITITMGGNDLGFASIIADCYFDNCIKDGTIARVKKRLAHTETQLYYDYEDSYGQSDVPDVNILVVGYPQIFEQYKWCQGLGKLGTGFSPAEEVALNDLTVDVDNTIQDAVNKVNDNIQSVFPPDGRPIHYVSVLHALGLSTTKSGPSEHQMCTAEPWVNEAGIEKNFTDSQAQAHPNALGQTAIAGIVAAYIEKNRKNL
jgi:lysophospholipase L1-like esterase